IHERAKNCVHETILSPRANLDGTLTVEASAEKQQEADAARQAQTEIFADSVSQDDPEKKMRYLEKKGFLIDCDEYFPSYFNNEYTNQVFLFPIANMIRQLMQDDNLAQQFEGIRISVNALGLPWTDLKYTDRVLSQPSCFSNGRIPFVHLRIEGSEVAVLTSTEVKGNANHTIDAKLSQGYPSAEVTEEVLLKIIKIKVLNGDSFFTDIEQKLLKKWIKEDVGAAKFKELLEKVAFRNQKHRVAEYNQNGVLRRILEEILAETQKT
ncbi:MAG: hypothetical protein WCF65_06835, partial [Parachlamydiaceae bacterium]